MSSGTAAGGGDECLAQLPLRRSGTEEEEEVHHGEPKGNNAEDNQHSSEEADEEEEPEPQQQTTVSLTAEEVEETTITSSDPKKILVGGKWHPAQDFIWTPALVQALELQSNEPINNNNANDNDRKKTTSTKRSPDHKLCDIPESHAIAACPFLHSIDEKVLVNKEYIRFRTLDRNSRAFQHLLSHPSHRGVLCGINRPHDAANCNFVHLVPNVVVGFERIARSELLDNAAVAHLLEFPKHRGRWCTNAAHHDAMACPFVHWLGEAPKKPPPKTAAAAFSKKFPSGSPSGGRRVSAGRRGKNILPVLSPQDKEEEEDALLAAHEAKTVESRRSIFAGSCGTGLGTEEEKEEANRDVGRLGSSNGTHEKMSRCHDDEDAESGETFSSALTGEKRRSAETRQLLLHGAGGVRAGTVLTLADVLPSSSFAKCLVASIFLVVAWLFASES